MRSHPDSGRAPGAGTERAATHEMPRWVKIFGAVAAIAVAIFAALHLADGGMGHLTHGNMGVRLMPAEHGHHEP